jgi:hypothetical protein
VSRLLVPVVLFALAGCPDEGIEGKPLLFRVAPAAPELGAMPTCPSPTDQARMEAPAAWGCMRIGLRVAGTDTQVPVNPQPDENGEVDRTRAMTIGGELVLLPQTGQVSFDIAFETDGFEDKNPAFDLVTDLFDRNGRLLAHGEFTDYRPTSPGTVHLYQPEAANCLDVSLRPRALHRLVRFPNGDVLVIGGVNGASQALRLTDLNAGFPLESVIESYRPSDGTVVEASSPQGGAASFAAVLFEAIPLFDPYDEDETPPYRIRTIGGFGARMGPVVAIDTGQTNTGSGAPLVPRNDGSMFAAPDTILEYDPTRRTVRVTAEAPPGPTVTLGWATAGEPIGDFVPVLGGIREARVGNASGVADYSTSLVRVLTNGMTLDSTALTTPRFGATLSRIADRGWLVWGGNIRSTGPTGISDAAALLLATDNSTRPLTVMGAAAESVPAFHSAATVGAHLVVAGGMQLGCVCPMGMPGCGCSDRNQPRDIHSAFASSGTGMPLAYLEVDETAGLVTLRPLAGAFTESAFHASVRPLRSSLGTLRPDTDSWLVTGGAIVEQDLDASRQLVRIDAGAVPTVGTLGPIASMIEPRFAHAAVALDDERILVTGGFRYVAMPEGHATIAGGELLVYEAPTVEPLSAAAGFCFDLPDGGVRDAAAGSDAAVPDAGGADAGVDAGM